MGLSDVLALNRGRAPVPQRALPDVAVLEDQPDLARLAVEMCEGMGLSAAPFRTPAEFLAAFPDAAPRMVVLDWRLERELGAAVFLAVRHRFGGVPIVCWTALARQMLPAMVSTDGRTRIVPKESGLESFEAAVRWALDGTGEAPPEEDRSDA